MNKTLKAINEFINDNGLEIEVLPIENYEYPRSLKPKHIFLVKEGFRNIFTVTVFKDNSFTVSLIDESFVNLVKEFVRKLKMRGITYVRT